MGHSDASIQQSETPPVKKRRLTLTPRLEENTMQYQTPIEFEASSLAVLERLESTRVFIDNWRKCVSPSRTASSPPYRARYQSDSFARPQTCSDRVHVSRPWSHSIPHQFEDSITTIADMNPRDAEGFAIPPSPSVIGGRSFRSSSPRSLVENPAYRTFNLAQNNIYLRRDNQSCPEPISKLIKRIQADRGSPEPSFQEVAGDGILERLRTASADSDVQRLFGTRLFPLPVGDGPLQRTDRVPMLRNAVPSVSTEARISIPSPDLLYGYDRASFPESIANFADAANSHDLLYPFLAVELRGDGPDGTGSFWVGTNKCLGSTATCINIMERLSQQTQACESEELPILNSAVFSIVMNAHMSRLYLSWKHDDERFYTKSIQDFLLADLAHYNTLRRYVHNIIDWAKGARLQNIQQSLDIIREENRRKRSLAARPRQPPSPGRNASGIGSSCLSPRFYIWLAIARIAVHGFASVCFTTLVNLAAQHFLLNMAGVSAQPPTAWHAQGVTDSHLVPGELSLGSSPSTAQLQQGGKLDCHNTPPSTGQNRRLDTSVSVSKQQRISAAELHVDDITRLVPATNTSSAPPQGRKRPIDTASDTGSKLPLLSIRELDESDNGDRARGEFRYVRLKR
ncbi:hypothetical protein HJFPF1_05179 [Paramyrothecium foliicola]|nr:hypothetical protein HJFPF1_05179 [Paramyrothecium foliicola]